MLLECNREALETIPRKSRIRKISSSRVLKLVGFDAGAKDDYHDWKEAPWAVVDVEHVHTGERICRLHYVEGPTLASGPAWRSPQIDDLCTITAHGMASIAMLDRTPAEKIRKKRCSYPYYEPGTLCRAFVPKKPTDGRDLIPKLIWSPEYVPCDDEKAFGIFVGQSSIPNEKLSIRPSFVWRSWRWPFPLVSIMTSNGFMELPANWLDEVRGA